MKPKAAPAAAAPAEVDPKLLERAAEETARMGRADRVFYWDRRQSAKRLDADGQLIAGPDGRGIPGPDVIVCGHDRTHGALIAHGSGSLLVCTASKGGAPCTFNQPVSV